MGMRFRKSMKAGPVRMTISKSGISTSIGTKATRVTTNSNGRTTVTSRIPGSGVSYSTSTSKKTTSKKSTQEVPEDFNKFMKVFAIIFTVICVIILVAVLSQ